MSETADNQADLTQIADRYLQENPDLRAALELFDMSEEQYAKALAGIPDEDCVRADSTTA